MVIDFPGTPSLIKAARTFSARSVAEDGYRGMKAGKLKSRFRTDIRTKDDDGGRAVHADEDAVGANSEDAGEAERLTLTQQRNDRELPR